MSSLKRLVPVRRSRRMSTTHLSLIRRRVVSTGQGGRSVIMPGAWMAWYFLWRMARWENPSVESGKIMDWNLGKSISESWENPLVENVIKCRTPTDILMTLTRPGYRPRLIDGIISRTLRTTGAVCIERPKWCGKTWSALNQTNSSVDLSDAHDDFQNRSLAETDPNLVLEGDAPHLIDDGRRSRSSGMPSVRLSIRNRRRGCSS